MNINELEQMIIMLKSHGVSHFKNADIEISLTVSNIIASSEEDSKPIRKPVAIWEDPDFTAALPMTTKLRGEI